MENNLKARDVRNVYHEILEYNSWAEMMDTGDLLKIVENVIYSNDRSDLIGIREKISKAISGLRLEGKALRFTI